MEMGNITGDDAISCAHGYDWSAKSHLNDRIEHDRGYVFVDRLRRIKLLMLLITVVKIGNVDVIVVVVVVDICVTLRGVSLNFGNNLQFNSGQ